MDVDTQGPTGNETSCQCLVHPKYLCLSLRLLNEQLVKVHKA
jgi:hypothetical protein